MEHTLAYDPPHRSCEVSVRGEVTLAGSRDALRALWADDRYAESRAALWDLGDSPLPPFEQLLELAAFVVREKHGRGPAILAIVSPSFSNSMIARAFRGFERIVGLDLCFFARLDDARGWIEVRTKAA